MSSVNEEVHVGALEALLEKGPPPAKVGDFDSFANYIADVAKQAAPLLDKDRHSGRQGRSILHHRIHSSASVRADVTADLWLARDVVFFDAQQQVFGRPVVAYSQEGSRWLCDVEPPDAESDRIKRILRYTETGFRLHLEAVRPSTQASMGDSSIWQTTTPSKKDRV